MITAGYTVRYESIDSDGRSTSRFFKTLARARRYAQERVGETPEIGSYYAVSGDGVGKITCDGCTLIDLFPACAEQFNGTERGWQATGGDADDRDTEAREAGPIAPTIQGYQLADDGECPF